MKIVFDCRSFMTPLTGIGSFTRNLIDSFIKYYPDFEYVLVSPTDFHPSVERDYASHTNVTVLICPFISKKILPVVWYQVYFPFILRGLHADWYFATKPTLPLVKLSKTRQIATVHDIVNIEFSDTMYLKNIISNKLFFHRSLKKSDLIWYNSHYTKNSLEKYYPEFIKKDSYVGLSIDTNAFRKLNLTIEEKRSILSSVGIKQDCKTILFVGSLEPRKNLSFLLRIMPQLYRNGYKLLIVGAKGWKNSDIAEIVNESGYPNESVIFCGYIDTPTLVKLYNSVDCFVSTSLNEGFGMPQLEALYCGCPVVCPNNSAMTEVVKGRGTLIDGWDAKTWVDTIVNTGNKNEGRAWSLDEYDWKNIVTGFVNKFLL